MTKEEGQKVLTSLADLDSINISELAVSAFPDRQDYESILLQRMSLIDFISQAKILFEKLRNVLTRNDIILFLPLSYANPELGVMQLDNLFSTLKTHLEGKNINAAENVVSWLAYYLIHHGLYDLKPGKSVEPKSEELRSIAEQLKLTNRSIVNSQKQVESLSQQVEGSKKEADDLIKQKKEELKQITDSVTTVNSQVKNISDLLQSATENSTRIKTVAEQQDVSKNDFDAKLKQITELYTTTNQELDKKTKETNDVILKFNEQVSKNNEHLEFVESKRSFFEERINYLNQLISQEVGASLFKTFDKRKGELNSTVNFWKWTVPVVSLITVIWIVCIFSTMPSTTDISGWWELFAVNTLKTVPVILLLLFCINQYRKERNFQEEYAFKSAVALTIDAYAERIKDSDKKDQMIIDSVGGVYKTPIEEGRTETPSKGALSTINKLVDTVNDVLKDAKK